MIAKHKLAVAITLGIAAGWLIGAVGLLAAVELTDGKAIDTAWLSN